MPKSVTGMCDYWQLMHVSNLIKTRPDNRSGGIVSEVQLSNAMQYTPSNPVKRCLSFLFFSSLSGHLWMTCRLVQNIQQLPYSMGVLVKEFAEQMFDQLLRPSSAASNQVILRLVHNSDVRLMSRHVDNLWQKQVE